MPGAATGQGRGGLRTGHYSQPRGQDLSQSAGPWAHGRAGHRKDKAGRGVSLEMGSNRDTASTELSQHGRNAACCYLAPQACVKSRQDAWRRGPRGHRDPWLSPVHPQSLWHKQPTAVRRGQSTTHSSGSALVSLELDLQAQCPPLRARIVDILPSQSPPDVLGQGAQRCTHFVGSIPRNTIPGRRGQCCPPSQRRPDMV